MAHVRQSEPGSGVGFKVKVLNKNMLSPLRLGAETENRNSTAGNFRGGTRHLLKHSTRNPKPETENLKPHQTGYFSGSLRHLPVSQRELEPYRVYLNPKSYTLDTNRLFSRSSADSQLPETLNPKPDALSPKPGTENPKPENCKQVIFEAARAICQLPNVSQRELTPAITVLQLFLSSPKPTLRSTLWALAKKSARNPVEISVNTMLLFCTEQVLLRSTSAALTHAPAITVFKHFLSSPNPALRFSRSQLKSRNWKPKKLEPEVRNP